MDFLFVKFIYRTLKNTTREDQMLETDFRSSTAKMGITAVDIASAIWQGGTISFVHPFNGNTSRAFDEGSPFQEGLAAVRLSTGKWCHITQDLEPAYKNRFDWVGSFHHGLAPAAQGEQMFHIDRFGQIVYRERYQYVGKFVEGLAAAKNLAGKMLHIYPNGKPAYRKRYCSVSDFAEGFSVAQSLPDGKMFFINHDGLPHGLGSFLELSPFSQGLAAAIIESGRAHHIDYCGNKPYPHYYHWVGSFAENFAPAAKKVQQEGTTRVDYFHVTRTGRRIYQENYSEVHPFCQGIAMVRKHNRKTRYIDMRGNSVSPII